MSAPGLDFLHLDDLLTAEERAVRDRVRAFVDAEVLPGAAERWERAETPLELFRALGRLGVLGGAIRGHGCPGLSTVGAGLVSQELSRGDGSLATFVAVQTGLAMASIDRCGSDEQRARWLPGLASGDLIGAFALTEPEVGSDAGSLRTRARRDGDHYVLDGAKRWIGNATQADLAVVWAADEAGKVGGYVVEAGAPGFAAQPIAGKGSMRSIVQADLRLEECRVPAANRLPGARGFRDTAAVLTGGRCGIAWAALGHALACYEIARAHALARQQFGRPIGAFQLVQAKLVDMVEGLVGMQLLALRAGRLADEGRLTAAMASLAKRSNAARARRIAADARDLLGGDGILLERHVIRHQADLEAVFTFEGTDHVNALLVGREITGLSAFG